MNASLPDPAAVPLVGRGKYWQQLEIGEKVRTSRRTITETDLVNFISVTGMLEAIFIDATHAGVVAGRMVPAALSYGIIEGFIFQTLIQGVGLALLSVSCSASFKLRRSVIQDETRRRYVLGRARAHPGPRPAGKPRTGAGRRRSHPTAP